jgi:putative heme-binding domain-containing protein
MARKHGDLRWMDAAIACSAAGAEKAIVALLVQDSGKGGAVMENLAGIIASRGNAEVITQSIAALETAKFKGKALDILKLGLEETKPMANKAEVSAPSAPGAEQIAAMQKRLPDFVAALNRKPDLGEGRKLFTAVCSVCHRSQGIGFSVGPDLDAEFQRAPEIILRDILFPSENIRPGFETVMAKTRRGETIIGIMASDSPTSATLRTQGGVERTLLRKHASISTVRNVSLMPWGLGEALKPEQVADIIAFLRQPRTEPKR